MSEKQIEAIGASVDHTIAYLKLLSGEVKKDGRRVTNYQAIYEAQSKNAYSVFKKEAGKLSFTDMEEYCSLIVKQVCPLVDQFFLSFDAFKREIARVEKEIKGNLTGDFTATLKKMEQRKEDMEQSFLEKWGSEEMLVVNYQMDVAAKQIERWTPLALLAIDKQRLNEEIDCLFD